MKRLLVVTVVLAFAVPCLGQTAQPPKPGPEVQKLGYLVGTRISHHEIRRWAADSARRTLSCVER